MSTEKNGKFGEFILANKKFVEEYTYIDGNGTRQFHIDGNGTLFWDWDDYEKGNPPYLFETYAVIPMSRYNAEIAFIGTPMECLTYSKEYVKEHDLSPADVIDNMFLIVGCNIGKNEYQFDTAGFTSYYEPEELAEILFN